MYYNKRLIINRPPQSKLKRFRLYLFPNWISSEMIMAPSYDHLLMRQQHDEPHTHSNVCDNENRPLLDDYYSWSLFGTEVNLQLNYDRLVKCAMR